MTGGVRRAGVNIELFHRMKRARGNVVAMPGVDFHSTSDASEVYMELDAVSGEKRELLEAVRAGRFRIMNGGTEVRIPEVGSSTGGAGRLLTTAVRDGSTMVYRLMKRSGIRVPDRMRLIFKRAL